MLNPTRHHSKILIATPLGVLLCSAFCAPFIGCGPAESVYHDGKFTEEQKAGAQSEYQSVEDEESQGSNKKKKPGKK
ncbi:MAG: hypothetical protein WCK15_15245 [Pirellula sp.]